MGGLPHFEAPTALEYFAALVADDASFSVLESALALAQDEDPALDVLAVLASIDELADRLRRRVAADTAALQRLRLLSGYFFRELGFAGNVNNYYDRRNSLLPCVLETRRGIPVTLAILFIELAAQIGLKAQGVSFPGHFLVKVQMPGGAVIIDPLSGLSLSRDDLEQRLLPYRRQRGLTDDDEAPLGLFLQAASGREIIARMLGNLKEIHRSTRDWPRLVAVQERLVILLPQAWEERRDRALAQAELGRHDLAADDMSVYLEHCSQADDAAALRRQLAAWRHLQP
jgi:regulator of sirC expression with transglutaminase-like and TPR domain